MKTFLVDDEPMALEVLEHMLSPYKAINIVGKYTKYRDLLEDFKKIKPDLIFLDIEMPEINGLELAEIIMGELEDVEIVFVTAYSQYAVEAFEVNAIDYLLKPVSKVRLEKAINRLKTSDIYIKEEKEEDELKIYSFNGFQVLNREAREILWRTKKGKELFAYLWIKMDKILTKDSIIEEIFPNREIDKASTLVHTTIYQLRKVLKELGYKKAIVYSQGGYQLDVPIRSDLEKLIAIIKKDSYNKKDVLEILDIYKKDFLEEDYIWAIELQQTYRHLVFEVLKKFAEEELERKRFQGILKILLDKLHLIDPFNDSIITMTIDYYGRQKERVNLEEFFKIYEEELWEEMQLNPSEEITSIYNKYME